MTRQSRGAPGRAGRATGPVAGTWPIDTGTVTLRPDGPDWIVGVNGVPSSSVCPGDPTRLAFDYLRQLAAVVALCPAPRPNILHLGGAGCALPWALAVTRPAARQVVVEVDAELARLVRTWFALPAAPQLRIRAGEAGAVVAGLGAGTRDLVIRDAFAGDRTPPHLAGLEFTTQVRRVLRPDGWYLANLADPDPRRVRSEIATVAAVFGEVAVVSGESGQRRGAAGNLVLVAAGTGSGAHPSPVPGAEPSPRPGLLPVAGVEAAVRRISPTARVLIGAALSRFVAGAAVLRDESVGEAG